MLCNGLIHRADTLRKDSGRGILKEDVELTFSTPFC